MNFTFNVSIGVTTKIASAIFNNERERYLEIEVTYTGA
jgi:hypothetical protein